MKNQLHLITSLCFMFVVQLCLAQKEISGNVSDSSGHLPGVNVIIKGTSNGTQTDFDGNYSITGDIGDVISFSYVGKVTQELTIGYSSTINVIFEDDNQLEEVIVIAYGTSKKDAFTGSATQIKAEDISKRSVTNVISVLDGASAGVKLTPANGQPGSSPTIRIRGIGSVNASSNPLIIVDGVEFVGNFSSLNPNDIEKLTVLKDAASTSLYGSRAANGVILITTKKGKSGEEVFTLDVSQGINSRSIPEYERVNAEEYYPLMWEALRNGFSISGTTPQNDANQMASNQIFGNLLTNPFNVPNTEIVTTNGQLNPDAELLYPEDLNWQTPLLRGATRSNVNFSYSGGSEKTNFYSSLSYLKDEGYIIRSNFERITGRINVNSKFNDWLKTGLNVSATTSTSNNAADGSSVGLANPFRTTRLIAPIYPVYLHNPITGAYLLDESGNRQFDLGENRVGSSSGRHIIQETLLNKDKNKTTSLNARTYAEATFLKDFTFTFNAALDKRFFNNTIFENTIVGDGATDGRGGRDVIVNTTTNYNQLLKYNRDFGNHSLGVLLGHENFHTERNFLTGFRSGLVADGNDELINFTTTLDLDSNTRNLTREGYFSSVTYDFNDKYYLSGSYRRDGSSRFAKDSRWGQFYSVGASWRMDRESFIQKINWINTLKLRGSYGEVGNDDLGSFYISQALFGLGFNNQTEGGILFSAIGNKDLTWETNVQSDIALEFGLFNDRVSGTVEYYNRKSKDLLFEVPLPVSSGVDDFPDNIGDMTNKGLEVDLNIKIVDNDDFKWRFNINAATLKNEITKLPQEEIINGSKKLVVGGDIFAYWLRDWYGVDPKDGSGLYILDLEKGEVGDADVRTTDDGTVVTTNQNKAKFDFVGTATPDLFGAFSSDLTYKGIELGFTFTYQLGGETYDTNYSALMHSGDYGVALSRDILNRWQKPGDVTDVPRLDDNQVAAFGAGSDRWLVKSDYLALRTLRLGYNLPSFIIDKMGVRAAKLYITGENLFVINARKGLESGQNFNGTTQNRFSPSRNISLGFNLKF